MMFFAVTGPKIVVEKSTVPVRTADSTLLLMGIVQSKNIRVLPFKICSTPTVS